LEVKQEELNYNCDIQVPVIQEQHEQRKIMRQYFYQI